MTAVQTSEVGDDLGVFNHIHIYTYSAPRISCLVSHHFISLDNFRHPGLWFQRKWGDAPVDQGFGW